MKNTKMWMLPLVIAAGLIGGVLRGMELTQLYDSYTGLYITAPLTYYLLGFCVMVLTTLSLFAYLLRPLRSTQPLSYKASPVSRGLGAMSGCILTLIGILYTISYFVDKKLSVLLFGILTVLCGIAFIVLFTANRKKDLMPEIASFAAIITVFWGCFMLIFVFMEHPVEPMQMLYVYDLLAMCAALLSIYGVAAQNFDRNRTKIALFGSLAAVFLLLVSGFGRCATLFFGSSAYYVEEVAYRLLVYSALLLYCIANTVMLLRNVRYTNTGAGVESDEV